MIVSHIDKVMEDSIKQVQKQLGRFLVWLIDTAPVPMELIYNTAKLMNIFMWRAFAVSQSTATGFFCALPGVNWSLGIGTDIFALLYSMAVTSYGVGAIIGSRNGYSSYSLKKSDYLDVLAVWSDSPEYIQDIGVKSVLLGGVAAKKAGLKIGTKAATKVTFYTASHLGSKAGAKIPAKLLEKVATKIATKLGVKTGAMLTGVGCAVSGGINAWFVNSITNAAKVYYIAKFENRQV